MNKERIKTNVQRSFEQVGIYAENLRNASLSLLDQVEEAKAGAQGSVCPHCGQRVFLAKFGKGE